MQVDYAAIQKQVTDLLPKYALMTDVKNRNVKLTQELQDRTNELAQAKSAELETEIELRNLRDKLEKLEK